MGYQKKGFFLGLYLLLTCLIACRGLEVQLGSRIFYTASETRCPNSDGRYNDTKNTGSFLFSTKGENYGQRSISTDILTDHWKPSGENCYRAHPVFLACLQEVLSDLKTARKRGIIYSGYKVYGDLSGAPSTQELYASAGTGVELMYEKGVADNILGIAVVVLRRCPAKFERIQRNIGIIMQASTVHFHMTGPDDGPSFSVDGYSSMNTATFQNWAKNAVDAGLSYGLAVLDCTGISSLSTNRMHPSTATSAEDAVGEADVIITRDNTQDFLSLVQLQWYDINVVNGERFADWCGNENVTCVDCRTSIVGNQADQRCASRLVTPRLNTVLQQLHVLAADYLADPLRIIDAFDEERTGHSVTTPSLFTEGRAVNIAFTSTVNTNTIAMLTRLAICSQADFVKNYVTYVQIAVRKMAGDTEQLYDFPETELLRVYPPSTMTSLTELRGFDDKTNAKYPLFDASNQEDVLLDDYATISKFKSPSSRYFRISPYIVECYSLLQSHYVEWENRTGDVVAVNVVRAFLTTEERDVYISPQDPRYLGPILGVAMEINLNFTDGVDLSSRYPLTAVAKLAIVKCGNLFQEHGHAMGLGIYSDRIYIDVRENFEVWNPSGSYPTGYASVVAYNTYLTNLYSAATAVPNPLQPCPPPEGRMVDPDYPVQACAKADPPALQSPDFNHVHSLYADHSRTNGADECVADSSTAFCSRTASERWAKFEYLWAETQKMHVYHHLNETMTALRECVNSCGTCTEGDVYLDKVLHCNNFIHWCPFEMIADGVVNINLFPRDNPTLRTHACYQGEHCIERSALFLLLVDTVESYYRTDASKSVEQELYSQTENPSPLMDLLHRLYAYSASGIVRVWVDTEEDLNHLQPALEAAMLYNNNVDEVIVNVNDVYSIKEVEMRMRRLITTWTTEGCTEFTREYVAPFTVVQMSNVIGKRSSEHNIRDELIHAHTHREEIWAHGRL